jgi:hypothetical protein
VPGHHVTRPERGSRGHVRRSKLKQVRAKIYFGIGPLTLWVCHLGPQNVEFASHCCRSGRRRSGYVCLLRPLLPVSPKTCEAGRALPRRTWGAEPPQNCALGQPRAQALGQAVLEGVGSPCPIWRCALRLGLGWAPAPALGQNEIGAVARTHARRKIQPRLAYVRRDIRSRLARR